jgi:hypothetical protein
MKIRTSVKAGYVNHSQTQAAPVIRTGVKAGALGNHSQTQR